VTAPLFFVDHDRLAGSDLVRLDGAEGRHAARVRRLTVGERLALADGAGLLCVGTVAEVVGDALVVQVMERVRVSAADVRIAVVQALAKGDRDELAVETMTEVGVDAIVPWAAARSVVRWDAAKGAKGVARWQSVAREASKQSRRPLLPTIHALARSSGVADRIRAAVADGGIGVVLHEDAVRPLAGVAVPTSGEIVVVVGPEGGIAADELASFEAAGALTCRLGPGVLRTSTAGVVAVTMLSMQRWS
jgi:16S rRNA (uracil1498-N3)-methyltransferase